MHPQEQTEPKAQGTAIGATLSLLLIAAFGFSSFMAQQKDTHYNASQPNNHAAVVRAYLA
jgi:hypothetical protein